MEVFEAFFGSENPFTVALDASGKQVKLIEKIETDIHKEALTERGDTHTADLSVDVECTLEEFFFGCLKKIAYTRNCLHADGNSEFVFKTRKEIQVKPGMSDGTVLRFKGEGNQDFGKHMGDLVICLKQKEHAKFMRKGNDLIYRHEINLADALLSEAIELTTIDGEIIKYRSESVITPHTTKLFKGKGMPVYSEDPLSHIMMSHSRGNMVLKFTVKIPTMTSEQRDRLVAVLQ